MEHLANNESKELGSRRKAAFFYVNPFHFGNSSLSSYMALTQDDWNKLSIIVSEVIDKKLDEKFDPIMDEMNLLSTKLEGFYARLEEFYARLDKILIKLDSICDKLDNITSVIRKNQTP